MNNLLRLTAVVFWLSSALGHADVIVQCTSNCPQQPSEQNILFGSVQTGALVMGFTNQSQTRVDFSSTTNVLQTPSGGQAMLTAVGGEINNLTISVPSHTFGDFIFDVEMGKLGKAGSLTLTADALSATDAPEVINLGTFSLGTGSNFFTIVATNNEVITDLTINSSFGIMGIGFQTLKQPRISGISAFPPPVAEPSSLIVLGTGLFSLGFLRRLSAH